MGSAWSKIWGSGYPNCSCGIAYIANCHCCGVLSPECCDKCDPGGGYWKQCFMIIIDATLIILIGIGLVVISDVLVGDEDGLNLLDDMGTFAEGGLNDVLKVWKSTMGGVHNTFYNLFHNTMKASGALSKLVAATLTAGLTISVLDLFNGVLGKLKNKCIGKMFEFWNTPFTFVKAELYNLWKPLGYLADIFLLPFEFVVAFLAMITSAIWDVLTKIPSIVTSKTWGGLICGQSLSPCCNDVSENSNMILEIIDVFFSTSFDYSGTRSGGGTGNTKLPPNPHRGRAAPGLGNLHGKMVD